MISPCLHYDCENKNSFGYCKTSVCIHPKYRQQTVCGTYNATPRVVIKPNIEPQRWILCSERLPERNGVYIVTRTISDGFEYKNIADACYFDGSDVWHDDTRVNHGRKYLADVVAWMPLPAPYREEGERNEQA